jgi:hypothetical protein
MGGRYSKEKPRFTDNLEVIKFICKEFWMELFKKQIDNLRTNHRGMYVLQENRFRPLLHLSTANKELSQTYTFFTCGVVRGALAAFGISVLVSAEVLALPACTTALAFSTSLPFLHLSISRSLWSSRFSRTDCSAQASSPSRSRAPEVPQRVCLHVHTADVNSRIHQQLAVRQSAAPRICPCMGREKKWIARV